MWNSIFLPRIRTNYSNTGKSFLNNFALPNIRFVLYLFGAVMQRNPLTHKAKEVLFVPVQHAFVPQTILTE